MRNLEVITELKPVLDFKQQIDISTDVVTSEVIKITN